MRRLFLLWLCVLVTVSCATAPPATRPVPEWLLLEDPFGAGYKVQCDDVSGKTVCVMTGNALRPFNPRYPMLALGLVSEADRKGSSRFFLRAVYVDEMRWLNIARKSPLVMTVGCDSFQIPGRGSEDARYLDQNGKVYEVALFETSADFIKQIAASKEVTVKVRGDYLLEKRFGPINQLYFQQFVRHYIDKPKAETR